MKIDNLTLILKEINSNLKKIDYNIKNFKINQYYLNNKINKLIDNIDF
tara:strand:- start:471 stop:614 length:144 start_codon:yes stop_codon:yes gene_type:complete